MATDAPMTTKAAGALPIPADWVKPCEVCGEIKPVMSMVAFGLIWYCEAHDPFNVALTEWLTTRFGS